MNAKRRSIYEETLTLIWENSLNDCLAGCLLQDFDSIFYKNHVSNFSLVTTFSCWSSPRQKLVKSMAILDGNYRLLTGDAALASSLLINLRWCARKSPYLPILSLFYFILTHHLIFFSPFLLDAVTIAVVASTTSHRLFTVFSNATASLIYASQCFGGFKVKKKRKRKKKERKQHLDPFI